MTRFFSSSRRPRWLNRKLRVGSRSTSCSAFHEGDSSSGASNIFSIHAEYMFSLDRFHESRIGQTDPCVAEGAPEGALPTVILRVIVAQSALPPGRVSVACHFPTPAPPPPPPPTKQLPPPRSP